MALMVDCAAGEMLSCNFLVNDDLRLTVFDNPHTAHLITGAAFNKRMADRLPHGRGDPSVEGVFVTVWHVAPGRAGLMDTLRREW
jgi:hypothetical protein